MAQSDTMGSRTNSTPHVNRDPPRLLTHPSSFQTPVWAKDGSSLSLSHPSSSTPDTSVVGQEKLTRQQQQQQQQNTRRPLVLHTPPPLPLPKGERPRLRKRSSSLPLLNTISTTSKDTQAEPSVVGSTLTSASTLVLCPTPPTKDDSTAGYSSCSSIIATPMGLGQSKHLPPTPTLTPSQLENGGHAHDAQFKEGGRREGNKLRRAFAARRRENIRGWKSEDVLEVLGSGTHAGSPSSSHIAATAVATTTTTTTNTPARPPEATLGLQVPPKQKASRSLPNPAIELDVIDSNNTETGNSAPHEFHPASPPNSRMHGSSHQRKDLPIAPSAAHGHSTPSHTVLGLGLHTTSIPTQATAPKPKKSYLVPPHLSISTSPSAPGAPSALSLLSSAAIPQTARSTASTKTNRTSVIPLSPGISSAVNYMMLQTPSPVGSPIEEDKGAGGIVKGKREEPRESGTSTTTASLPSKATSREPQPRQDEGSSPANLAGQAHERQHMAMAATSTAVPIVPPDATPIPTFASKPEENDTPNRSGAEVPPTSTSSSVSAPLVSEAEEARTFPNGGKYINAASVSALALNPQSRNQMSLKINGADSSGAKDSALKNESAQVVATMPTTTTVTAGTSSSMTAPPSIQSVAPPPSSLSLPSLPASVQTTSIPSLSTAFVPFTSSASTPSSPPHPQVSQTTSNRFSLTNRPRPLSTGTTSTARAGGSGPGSAGASRPVSWAESFQSACTVVPGEDGRRRLSALALSGEKWKEEDEYLDAAEQEGEGEEEFFSAPSTAAVGSPPPMGVFMDVSTANAAQKPVDERQGRPEVQMRPEDKTQSKLRNRRSMSLDSTSVLREPLALLASKRSKELLSSATPDDAKPSLFPALLSAPPQTREDTVITGNTTGKEDKPEVPPKPKRYEPNQHQQKPKHIRAPSIGSSISQPAGSVSSHSESVSGPSGHSNSTVNAKGSTTLGSGVYAHAHGKSSSHSNLLSLSSYEREKQEKHGQSHPPSTMHNAGLRSRFVAWTGMGSSSSTDGERRKETSSASSISMSMGSGTGSVTSFSSNSNAVGQASLSSSPSSFSGFSGMGGVPHAPHSHLGHGQSGHAQMSHVQGQHLAQNHGTPTHPHGYTHRATTPSVSGLGPAAAGLAKRAVEKMGRKWGAKIGFGGLSGGTSLGGDKGGEDGNGSVGSGGEGSSTSAEARVKHKRTPNAKSGGWLPGAFVSAVSGGSGGNAAGAHVTDGTGSSISSSIASLSPSAGGSTCATSMSGVSLGPEGKGHAYTNPTSLSTAGGSSNSGDPFSQNGPNLGRVLCGPLRAKGGVVFGKELKNAVRDARCVTWEESEAEDIDDDETDSEVEAEGYDEGEGDVSWSWSEDESGAGDEKKPGVEGVDDGAFLRVKKTTKARSTSQTRKRRRRKQGLVKRLENREVPAIVVRCAQHVLIWGVREEGLFRVPGRSRHVNTLRQEFDTGADWDMTGCSPGDLDPHAVASVFKAYLRELPEPILTHKLQPYFDAAITKENSVNEQTQQQQVSAAKTAQPGAGLPSNPKSGHNPSGLRKPLSLSTLAMPTFSGLPPPSRSLINAIRSLIAQLPTENRDLIRTVVDLIKATARESKETKMPLTNLMLVFCPSLNMSPPLLKVLCEAPGIWPDEMEEGVVIDIRRRSARANEVKEGHDEDIPPPTPAKDRNDIQTVYLDTMSHMSSSSVASSPQQDSPTPMTPPPPSAYNRRQRSRDDESVSSVPFSFAGSRNAARTPSTPLSSEAESVVTPTSSANPSFASLPMSGKRKNSNASISLLSKKPSSQQLSAPQIVEPSPSPLPSPIERRRPLISNPIPITGPVHFPSADMSQPPTPKKREGFVPQPPTKRRSIPLLSLASFSSGSASKESSTNASPKSGNNSPGFMPVDADGQTKEPRMKKPSLKLLFSKKSSSSLTLDKYTPDNSAGGSSNKSYGVLGLSVPNPPFYGADRYASSERGGSPRTASDSSISTPLSAHTAPQGNSGPGSVLSIPMGMSKSNSFSSTNEKVLPSVLDTPIEDSSFVVEGMGVVTPSTATTVTVADSAGPMTSSTTTTAMASPSSGASSTKMVTPKADVFPHPPTLVPLAVLPPPRSDSLPPSTYGAPPVSPTAGRRSEEQTARLRSLRGKHYQPPSLSASGLPTLNTLNGSTMSLSLDGLGEVCEDWTSSVLMAADEAVGESA